MQNYLQKDLVSAVVTCYNYGAYLDEALSSLEAQSYKKLEVIVVDDESTDPETIKTFDRLKRKYRKFFFFRITHRGVAEARNYGIKKSSGEFVFALDADDCIKEEYVSTCVSYLKKNPEHAIVTTYVKTFGENSEGWKTKKYDLLELCTQNMLHISSMYRREVFDAVGGYDINFPGYEDWDFWLSAGIKGYVWGLIPQRIFLYRIKKSSLYIESMKKDSKLYSLLVRKHMDFFVKNHPDILSKFREELIASNKFHQELIEKFARRGKDLKKNKEMLKASLVRSQKEIHEYQMRLSEFEENLSSDKSKIARMSRVFKKQIDELETRISEYERERAHMSIVMQNFSKSRYLHLKNAILQARSLRELVVLPFKIIYVFLPQIMKIYWRKIKYYFRVRLYIERQWSRENPLVSIIIPVFNYGHFLKSAIRSINAQTFTDYEVIIVEGGSTDGKSPDFVRNIKGKNIRTYFRKERHYAGSNRDFGIQRARGKYILCFDPDDRIEPTFLEKAVFVAETFRYDVVGSWLKAFGNKRYTYPLPPTPVLEDEVVDNKINQTSLFRKDLYFKAGRYKDWIEPGKPRIAEDWEFWVRMLAAGARVYNIQEPLFLYRHHDQNITVTLPTLAVNQHREKISRVNKEILTPEAFRRSRNRRDLLYINIAPLKNFQVSNPSEKNFFSAIPMFALGGADLVYQQVEQSVRKKFRVHIVGDVPIFPEMKEIIDGHRKISPRLYEVYKQIPYVYGAEGMWYRWSAQTILKYLLTLHPPSAIYQGGSKLWYRIFPWIKKTFPQALIVDNQFNIEGHVRDLVRFQKYVDLIMVESEFMKNFLKKRLTKNIPFNISKIGVDTKVFRPRPKKYGLFDYKIEPGSIVVTYIGRFSREKGVETFMECAKRMNDPKVKFLLAGYGPLEEQIRKRLEAEKKAYSNLHLVGCVRDQTLIYAESDIVVVPSNNDGTPNVIKEALASGLPVIGTNVGGIPSMIPATENIGFVCKAGDVDCINRYIKKLAWDKSLLEQFKSNARKYAVRVYTRDLFKEICREIFSSAI